MMTKSGNDDKEWQASQGSLPSTSSNSPISACSQFISVRQ